MLPSVKVTLGPKQSLSKRITDVELHGELADPWLDAFAYAGLLTPWSSASAHGFFLHAKGYGPEGAQTWAELTAAFLRRKGIQAAVVEADRTRGKET